MFSLFQKNLLSRILETIDLSRLLPFYESYLRRSWAIEGSASVWMVKSVRQLLCSDLGSLLFILFTSKLIHIVGNHIVGYADHNTAYMVIHRPLSRPEVME